MLKAIKWLYNSILLTFDVLLSLFRILLYSSRIRKSEMLREFKKRVFILGNGPSVKDLIKDNYTYLSNQNLIVVNDFFQNEYFDILRPRLYVVADPAYWEEKVTEDMIVLRMKMQNVFMKKVVWNMLFFVPSAIFNSGYYQKIFQSNTLIKILPFNTTPFLGPKKLRYFFYDKILAKPTSGNVIGSAIFIALQMNIQEILLFGVEHSWTRNLYVDDQNRTCLVTEHFYENEQKGTVWLRSDGEPYSIHGALYDISIMLGGYFDINEYANYLGIKIFNCTPDSFIDAFERKKLEDIK
jgi:hypothetical protein